MTEMSRPGISVVVPVYQGEAFLAEAIESVLRQTLPAAEIIVVDDGSTDGTALTAARFGSAVKYEYQAHGGIGAARNRGIGASQMEYLCFLDADDFWSADKLALQVAVLDAVPAPDLVFGLVQQFRDPRLSSELKARIQCPDEPMPGLLSGTLLVRRETVFRVGLFDTQWRSGEFIDWYLRATELGLTTLVLPQVVLHRRLHASNHGLREREARGDLLHILKASLDRRRATPPGEPIGRAVKE